jgi:putative RNA 2'-phosphotransferase
MEPRLVRISRFLSRVLRHRPQEAGLTLDAHGWADVDAVLAGAQRRGFALDRATLLRVVAENDKQRFTLSPDGQRIRANQGHSLPVDLELEALVPPDVLYHGTATQFLGSIRREGLRSGRRQHVHLSPDAATAARVGGRHGTATVLTVEAARMHAEGHVFYCSANGVWLTDHVPAVYLSFPESAPTAPAAASDSAEARAKTLWLKDEYLAQILAGRKTIEVRVAYANIARLQPGDRLLLNDRHPYVIRRIGHYASFVELLAREDPAAIAPDLAPDALLGALRAIYPAEKEALGVVALELGAR